MRVQDSEIICGSKFHGIRCRLALYLNKNSSPVCPCAIKIDVKNHPHGRVAELVTGLCMKNAN